jgi:uncharacterized protein YodC (DUF2158 family)
MSVEQLREGDVVRLKSGGPPMTIVGYSESNVQCKWFDGNKVQEDWFPMYSITKVPDVPDI